MKLNYQLSNVLGAVYHDGNLLFDPTGYRIFSPVGNKVVQYDLLTNTSQSLPFQTEHNIRCMALSPNGFLLLVAAEGARLFMVAMSSGMILHRKIYRDCGNINAIEFSPNGAYYAICTYTQVIIYKTPGVSMSGMGRELDPFKLVKAHKVFFDETTCVSWSPDSRHIVVGSKDTSVKIIQVEKCSPKFPRSFYNLSGHKDEIVACFFAAESEEDMNVYSIAKDAVIVSWESNMNATDLVPKKKTEDEKDEGKKGKLRYDLKNRFFLDKHLGKAWNPSVRLTSCAYNSKTKMLITGYSNGSFVLIEMPDCTLISNLQLSNAALVNSIKLNPSGDWIAIGAAPAQLSRGDLEKLTDQAISSCSQLLVWEWQSETWILKQKGTGAGVANLIDVVAISPDASCIASGGTDGKVRLWNSFNGFNYVTFGEEHQGPITAIEFVMKNGKVLLSASLDGTVRAYDLQRYRNFRTLSAAQEESPAQFISLAVDTLGGDFVAAGSQNMFEIFLWSLQTGRLLESLAGHTGPVSGVKFSPIDNTLVSCSWDGTVRIWELFQGSKCTRQVVNVNNECLALAFRPDGHQFAVATLRGRINFYNPEFGDEMGVPIEGKPDLGISQVREEIIQDKDKYFTTISYSADGQHILAAGRTKYICIYNVKEKILLKKMMVTHNLSMNGMFDYISKRKRAEFGFNVDAIQSRDPENQYAPIALPGVKVGDFSSRAANPIIAVFSITFSPTMRYFVCASTEGVMMYSLDVKVTFDPFHIDTSITPQSIKEALRNGRFSESLMMSLRLNHQELIREVMESTPISDIQIIVSTLPDIYAKRCIDFVSKELDSSRHIEFYMIWATQILELHGVKFKMDVSSLKTFLPSLRNLQRSINRHENDLRKIFEHNIYLIRFLNEISALTSTKPVGELMANEESLSEDEEPVEQQPEIGMVLG